MCVCKNHSTFIHLHILYIGNRQPRYYYRLNWIYILTKLSSDSLNWLTKVISAFKYVGLRICDVSISTSLDRFGFSNQSRKNPLPTTNLKKIDWRCAGRKGAMIYWFASWSASLFDFYSSLAVLSCYLWYTTPPHAWCSMDLVYSNRAARSVCCLVSASILYV